MRSSSRCAREQADNAGAKAGAEQERARQHLRPDQQQSRAEHDARRRHGQQPPGWEEQSHFLAPSIANPAPAGKPHLDGGRAGWHCEQMTVGLATRLRALWLACLLVLAPAGPLGLLVSGHATGADSHVDASVHDAADHGISAGALAEDTPDRHCLYCQTASSLRFGWVEVPQHLRAPSSAAIDWIELQGGAPRSDSRAALPARAPPSRA